MISRRCGPSMPSRWRSPRASSSVFSGPNGAGKTTTIRLLLGLLEPTAGRAEVLGCDTVREAQRIRTQAGALLEHAGLYERLTAEDNLEFYGRVWRMPAGRPPRAHPGVAHPLRAVGSARRDGGQVEPRHEAEAGRRPRAAAPAVARLPRRADGRPRPGGVGGAARRPGRAGGARGGDGVPQHAQPRRGREALLLASPSSARGG